jgi:hypothetical protein
MVKCFADNAPGTRRVDGLTMFTLAMENLSPTLNVSPVGCGDDE